MAQRGMRFGGYTLALDDKWAARRKIRLAPTRLGAIQAVLDA